MALPHTISDPLDAVETIATRNRKVRLATRQYAEDLAVLMGTTSGRRIVWAWTGGLDAFNPTFDPNIAIMAHEEGRRAPARELLIRLQRLCPDLYMLMQKENDVS